MKKKLIVFLLVLSGCEVVVDVNIPFDHSSLVVNSLFNPDSVFNAFVSRDQYILDTLIVTPVIDDALVIVYENNVAIDTLNFAGYYYRSDRKPLPGVEYEFRVSAPNFEPVSARSTAPAGPSIDDVFIGEEIYDEGRTTMDIRVRFKDDGAVENFYEITVETVKEYLSGDGSLVHYTDYSLLESDEAYNAADDQLDRYSLVWKDILFNGKDADLSFHTIDARVSDAQSLIVRLKTISKDIYQYRSTVEVQDFTSGNPFAQPVSVYNNIQNGFGIVGGFSQTTFERRKPAPKITSITPLSGKVGDEIVISGENLFDIHNYATVFFNGSGSWINSWPTEQYETQLKVIVPEGAVTGKLAVDAAGGVVISDEIFEVVE